ncbi:MAG: SLBB domain-containing protein, partial [Verrucomicrobiales bacterium]|nr:SLBB domain-containing protein [Verrucomicrobiales bacterium]
SQATQLRCVRSFSKRTAATRSSISPESSGGAPRLTDPWEVLLGVYLLGVTLVLARRLVGEWQLRKMSLARADSRSEMMVIQLTGDLGINKSVRVVFCPQACVPMTWGVFRPVIALPPQTREWSAEALGAAVRHEVAHIHHGDQLKRLLCLFVTAFFWPHPLVWLAARRWRLEQEKACDDFVLSGKVRADEYATQLLQVAKSFQPGTSANQVALVMAMPFGLESRIHAVVDPTANRRPPGRASKSVALGACLAITSLCALCQAENDPGKVPANQVVHVTTTFSERVQVTTKFVEIDTLKTQVVPEVLKKAIEVGSVVLGGEVVQGLIGELSQKQGVHLMSAPPDTTPPGSWSNVYFVREFIYPTEFEMKDGTLTPVTFEMMPLGVTSDIKPILDSDGVIQLKSMSAHIAEFDGWVTGGVEMLDSIDENKRRFDSTKILAGRKSLVPMDQAPSSLTIPSGNSELWDINKGKDRKKDEVSLPLFTIQEWSGETSLKPGEWLVSYLKRVSGDPTLHDGRRVWCLVSAERVVVAETKPVTIRGRVKRQGIYPHQPGMTLNDLLKKAQGVTRHNGTVKIHRGAEQPIKLDATKDGSTPLNAGDSVIVE